MATRTVHVYRVREMTVVQVTEARDDVDAMQQALVIARATFVPQQADCHLVAVMPSGARRDLYGKRVRRRG